MRYENVAVALYAVRLFIDPTNLHHSKGAAVTDLFDTLMNIETSLAAELVPKGTDGPVALELPPGVEEYISNSYHRSLEAIMRGIRTGDQALANHAPITAITMAFYVGYRAGRGDTIIDPPRKTL